MRKKNVRITDNHEELFDEWILISKNLRGKKNENLNATKFEIKNSFFFLLQFYWDFWVSINFLHWTLMGWNKNWDVEKKIDVIIRHEGIYLRKGFMMPIKNV